MSRGMCGTIKAKPAFAAQRVFLLTGAPSGSVTHWENTARRTFSFGQQL